MSTTYHRPRTIFVIAVLISVIAGAVPFARADGEVALMNRVNTALRGNDRLNGAKAYTAAPGVIVLYGMVFDDKDRALTEQTANGVSGAPASSGGGAFADDTHGAAAAPTIVWLTLPIGKSVFEYDTYAGCPALLNVVKLCRIRWLVTVSSADTRLLNM